MRITTSALIVALALGATSAAAQDQVGYAAIKKGNYAAAEKALTAQYRNGPGQPEVMLNLAAVYARTGRPEQARDLYRQVIAAPDILMDLPQERTANSHTLAEIGLKRLYAAEISSR